MINKGIPNLVFALKGSDNIYDSEDAKMTVYSSGFNFPPYGRELVTIPSKTGIEVLKHSRPFYLNITKAHIEQYEDGLSVTVASLPVNQLRLFLPSGISSHEDKDIVYAPVGFYEGSFVTTSIKMDEDKTNKLFLKLINISPENRQYIDSLKKMAEYAGSDEIIVNSFDDNKLIPVLKDIISVGYDRDIIVSFQPCNHNYEQLLNLAEEVKKLNASFITLNLELKLGRNCFSTEALEIFHTFNIHTITFLDTQFTSLNSEQLTYESFCKIVELVKNSNKLLSFTIWTMPGINDRESHVNSLISFFQQYEPGYIRFLNLKGTPFKYYQMVEEDIEDIISIKNMIIKIRKNFKLLPFGTYNIPKSKFNERREFPNLKK